jgi:HEAT repeat protein
MRFAALVGSLAMFLLTATDARAQAPDVARLTAGLSAATPAERYDAADALADLGLAAQPASAQLIAALATTDAELRWRAARALGASGSAAAAPALLKAAADQNALVRAQAIFALGRLGVNDQQSLETIVSRLSDPDVAVRRASVRALQMIRPDRQKMIPLVVKLLEDSDPHIAMRALHTIAEGGAESLPALIAALDHPEARYWACLAISEMGAQAKTAVPGLVKVLADERPEVRLQAAIALAEVGPDARPAAAALVKLLADPFEPVRHTAAFALGRIGDKSAAQALGELQTSKDTLLQSLSIWALAKMYPDDKARQQAAIGHLVLKLADKDRAIGHIAARAIAELSPPDDVIRPAMDKLIAGADAETADRIFTAYASLGPKIVPLAINALKDAPARRERALQVLLRLGEAAAPATPELVTIIQKGTPQEKSEALFIIGAIGPKADAAVAAAAAALGDADPKVKLAAAYAIGKIGPAAKEALPALTQLAASDDEMLKLSSVWAMLQLGVMNEELNKMAVPLLAKALGNEREFVRVEAAMSLGKLGKAATAALPALEKAQTDSSPAVRSAAAEAAKMIKG